MHCHFQRSEDKVDKFENRDLKRCREKWRTFQKEGRACTKTQSHGGGGRIQPL